MEAIIIQSDEGELEVFSGEEVTPEVVAFAIGPRGEQGPMGDLTPEAEYVRDQILAVQDEVVQAKSDAQTAEANATFAATEAASSAASIQGIEGTVTAARDDVLAAAGDVETARTAAEGYALAAATSEANAETHANAAISSASAAALDADAAAESELAAAASASAADQSEQNSKASEVAAGLSEDAAAASAAAALQSETNAGLSEDAAAASAGDAAATKTAIDGIKLEIDTAHVETVNARDEVVAAKTVVEGARDATITARNTAQGAATTATDARDAAQNAQTATEGLRDEAAASAAAAAQSAADAALFDPSSYPLKSNNGSDFADPAAVRANIGAQAALEDITEAEILAGTATTARNWSAATVKQAVVAHGGEHTHDMADIDGLNDELTGLQGQIGALQTSVDLKAPLDAPVFTGNVRAPTVATATDSTTVATTAFVWSVYRQLTDGADTAFDTFKEIQDWITQHGQEAADIVSQLSTKANINHQHAILDIDGLQDELDLKAPLASPALTGTPTAPTALHSDNSTQLATTAHVKAAIANSGLATEGHLHDMADVNGLEDALAGKAALEHDHEIADTNGLADELAAKAPLASPALTGSPTAPTALVGDSTTKIATTAFVTTAVANGVSGKADVEHDHEIEDITDLQTTLDAKAPLASPTLTGAPKAPTAAAGTNTTQIATTAFVKAAVDTAAATKADAEHDHEIADINGLSTQLATFATTTQLNAKANSASPTFTGTVTITHTGHAALEIGRTDGTASTPFVDFHSGATATDYDVRLMASGGNGTAGNGTLAITAAAVTVSGTLTAANDVTAFSDARLKADVSTIEDALAMVGKMRGVRYTMNGQRSIGVIAQELREVAPELVREADDEPKTLSVAYGNAIGILIEAIKELKAEVDELKRAA